MATLVVPGYGTANYGEIPGSPKEYCQGGQWKVRREFLVDWNSRWLFALGMLGTSSLTLAQTNADNSIDYAVTRVVPQGYATQGVGADQKQWLFATGIDSMEPLVSPATPFKDTYNVANYQQAKVAVVYEAPTYNVLDDLTMAANGYTFANNNLPDESTLKRFVTKVRQPTAEYLTLPVGAYKFVTPGQNGLLSTVRGSHGRIIAAKEIVYIWHGIPGVPTDYSQYLGTVNTNVFDGYLKGTLLLTGVEVRPYRWFPASDNTPNGTRLYDVTYKMKYFSAVDPETGLEYDDPSQNFPGITDSSKRGHNYFLRFDLTGNGPASGRPFYDLLTRDGGLLTSRVYQYRDFHDLFTFKSTDDTLF